MKRIGVLGLALAIAVAICSVAATSASAAGGTCKEEPKGCWQYGFKSATYPAEVKGTNTDIHGFEITGAVSLCHKATFNTNEEKAPNPTKPQKTLEVHPVYTECLLSLAALKNNASAVVRTTGCNYVFTALEPGNKTGKVTIKCEAGKTIEVESLGVSGCVIKTGPQTLTGIEYKNEAGGKVKVNSSVEKIKYSASSQCGLGILTGENGVYKEGEEVLGVAKLGPGPASALSESFAEVAKTFQESEVNILGPHYYSEGALAGSTPITTVGWGTIHLLATEGSPTGANAVCHNAAGGTYFNPGGSETTSLTTGLNGAPGEGKAEAFATFQCEQENICSKGEKSTHVIAPLPEAGKLGLPWPSQLTEEVAGTTRTETSKVRVIFLCEEPAGTVLSEVPYILGKKKASAELEKGQRPNNKTGTSALHPGFSEFGPAKASGELEVEGSLGKVRSETSEGAVKALGYDAQELINIKTP